MLSPCGNRDAMTWNKHFVYMTKNFGSKLHVLSFLMWLTHTSNSCYATMLHGLFQITMYYTGMCYVKGPCMQYYSLGLEFTS